MVPCPDRLTFDHMIHRWIRLGTSIVTAMEIFKNWEKVLLPDASGRLATALADPQIGFARHYTSHMVEVDIYCEDVEDEFGRVVRAQLRPYGDISLSPACNGLHYSQVAFEGMLCFVDAEGVPRLFRPQDHYHRLNVSAQRMGLPRIAADFMHEALRLLVDADRAWLDTTRGHALYIRPILFANEPQLGVQAGSRHFKFLIIMALHAGMRVQPLQLYVPRLSASGQARAYVRATLGGTGAVKAAANYGGTILPLQIANKQGANEVLWLGAQNPDLIEEAGTSNVFFVIDDQVFTPRLNGSILPGITRDAVIQLLRAMGFEVIEKDITFTSLLAARNRLREAFATGTASSVKPITRIDCAEREIVLEDVSLALKLSEALQDVQWGRVTDGFGWMQGIRT
jgi:branched-chain amino acid aminotransferase